MTILDIAHVDPINGEIKTIRNGTGAILQEEHSDENGNLMISLDRNGMTRIQFIDTHYYDWATKEFVEKPPKPNAYSVWNGYGWAHDIDRLLRDVRAWRNMELIMSDFTQLPDSPVDSAAWAVYRQELRDLPALCWECLDWDDVPLPQKPE